MPRYEQRCRLTFTAENDEHALEVEDEAGTALSRTGSQLTCDAALVLAPRPPRRLEELPREALIVTREQALAAASCLERNDAGPPVILQLCGELLCVMTPAASQCFNPAGDRVPHLPQRGPHPIQLRVGSADLRRQVAHAVVWGQARVTLSRPTGATPSPERRHELGGSEPPDATTQA